MEGGGGETSTVYDCLCRVCDNKQWKGGGGERPVQCMIVCAGYVITSNGKGGGETSTVYDCMCRVCG